MRELYPTSENPWYALTVRHQHEWQVEQLLSTQGFDTLAPSYKADRQWSNRTKSIQLPLFAGYLFCRFGTTERARVLRTPGVTSVVSFAGTPAPVDEEEMSALERAARSGLPLYPWARLKRGDTVRIERGPLKGIEGTLLADGDCLRLIIRIELLQRAVAVELTPDTISPIRTVESRRNTLCEHSR